MRLGDVLKDRITDAVISNMHAHIERAINSYRVVVLDFDGVELSVAKTYFILTRLFMRMGETNFCRYIKFFNISDTQKLIIESQVFAVFRSQRSGKRRQVFEPNTVQYIYNFFSSKKELATLLGVRRQTVARWENQGNIPFHALKKLHHITDGKINHGNVPYSKPRGIYRTHKGSFSDNWWEFT